MLESGWWEHCGRAHPCHVPCHWRGGQLRLWRLAAPHRAWGLLSWHYWTQWGQWYCHSPNCFLPAVSADLEDNSSLTFFTSVMPQGSSRESRVEASADWLTPERLWHLWGTKCNTGQRARESRKLFPILRDRVSVTKQKQRAKLFLFHWIPSLASSWLNACCTQFKYVTVSNASKSHWFIASLGGKSLGRSQADRQVFYLQTALLRLDVAIPLYEVMGGPPSWLGGLLARPPSWPSLASVSSQSPAS